jgi:hypothetical protein
MLFKMYRSGFSLSSCVADCNERIMITYSRPAQPGQIVAFPSGPQSSIFTPRVSVQLRQRIFVLELDLCFIPSYYTPMPSCQKYSLMPHSPTVDAGDCPPLHVSFLLESCLERPSLLAFSASMLISNDLVIKNHHLPFQS